MRIKKSNWKYPSNNLSFKIFKRGEDTYKVYDRNITLTTQYLNKILRCYKGKVIGKLLVTSQHLGHKLGEFFITKILGERIAYRKKQKLLLKKSKGRQKQSTKKK